MKNVKMVLALIFSLPLALIMAACSQDPIFFIISREVAPKDPRIEGAPTAMVVFERNYAGCSAPIPIMYVASSRLHWYAKPKADYALSNPTTSLPKWDSTEYKIPQPAAESGWKIISLAATNNYLYVLSNSDSGTAMSLKRIGKNENDPWETIAADPAYPKITSIYADSKRLFVGAAASNSYAIFYMDESIPSVNNVVPGAALKMLVSSTEFLTGAAFDGINTHYLSTNGKGIYSVRENSLTSASVNQLSDSSDSTIKELLFKGIFEIKNGSSVVQVVAITRGDKAAVYDVGTTVFTKIASLNKYATGALALYEDKGTGEKLLLAGVLDSTITSGTPRGYLEIDLNSSSSKIDGNSEIHEPGKKATTSLTTTVTDNDRYAASLRKYPINHLFQTPSTIDSNRTLFASTETTGLWSYRVREGGEQWNAEE